MSKTKHWIGIAIMLAISPLLCVAFVLAMSTRLVIGALIAGWEYAL